jgi:GABA(A) receptor-associated protein
MNYKSRFSFNERKKESEAIMRKYPDKIPVICTPINAPNIIKNKYLVSVDVNIMYLLFIIRQNMKVAKDQGLFIIINNTIPPSSEKMLSLYNMFKDDDGFLYINYTMESVFG